MPPTTTAADLSALQRKVWDGTLPLEIRLASAECRTYDQSDPYLIHVPRLSYLPLLLPRLHAFFRPALIDPAAARPAAGWFAHQGVPLPWHYPVGLLYDVYAGAEPADGQGELAGGAEDAKGDERRPPPAGPEESSGGGGGGGGGDGDGEDAGAGAGADALPWRLELRFQEWPDAQMVRLDEGGRVLADAFANAVKEADFLRYGSAKASMSLSKDDSTNLWKGVATHNLAQFSAVNRRLLNPPGATLRHLPLRVYLPHSNAPDAVAASADDSPVVGSLRVVQGLVSPMLSSKQPQTVGTALHTLLPSLFPSRRSPLLAQAVLHGAIVPLAANVEELARHAAYADGWVHLGVVMMG